MKGSPFVLSACCLGLACALGCGGDDIAVYRAAKAAPGHAAAARLPEGHPEIGPGRAPAREAAGTGIEWKTPEGWEELPGSGMRHATFRIGRGEDRAEMSVVILRGEGGGLLANANRWRGQLGLEPVDAAGLSPLVRKMKSPAGEASVLDLRGSGTRILAAVLSLRGDSWYFKMTGPSGVVGRAKPAFLRFIGGLREPGRGG